MSGRLSLGVLVIAAMGAAIGIASAGATGGSYADYEVKAAFLYNFARFVEWPPDAFARPDSPIVIGIVGEDPFGPTLERVVQGRQIDGRALVIRRLRWTDEVAGRHILFISSADPRRARQLLHRLQGAPILSVGELPGFADEGVVINFVVEQSRVRFEINTDAARRARLSISSRLLSLARIVDGERSGG